MIDVLIEGSNVSNHDIARFIIERSGLETSARLIASINRLELNRDIRHKSAKKYAMVE